MNNFIRVSPTNNRQLITIYDAKWFLKKKAVTFTRRLGIICLAFSLAGIILFLTPAASSYILVSQQPKGFKAIISNKIVPAQFEFYLTIGKINLYNALVVPKVNMDYEGEYENALSRGLAHASGTGLPGSGKMIYIFGHSTNYPWLIQNINALFYNLDKLENGDKVNIDYNEKNFSYIVYDKKIVNPDDANIIYDKTNEDILILQTCWPKGTTLKRLLIFAKLEVM